MGDGRFDFNMPPKFLRGHKKKNEGKERKVKEGKKKREAPYWF